MAAAILDLSAVDCVTVELYLGRAIPHDTVAYRVDSISSGGQELVFLTYDISSEHDWF